MTDTFSCSIEVPATPDVVFDYFTQAHLLVSWIGNHAVLDARPDGEFTLDIEGIPVRGRYLDVSPHERVVVSWGHAGSDTLPPASTEVEFRLTRVPAGTLVEVEHRGLPAEHLPSHRQGWPMFLGRLRQAAKDVTGAGVDETPDARRLG